ncbi:SPOR domain-containing protein [Mycetocola tolaasinivorans]|uniref:SPOR domain-containing protein n=1 Tax=Mycetocola tolaasinivorans TaxID=76635 RepID=A0A3L7AC18_9MICO|nr:SPOR domain-containing protein [Mycetocola tolaasinivorans]RLP76932.1 SPOR domain-containing protein [Mycetocola tolaasinivorans]
MATDPATQYWYNTRTGAVEQGFVSPAADRVGPFETQEEAAHAMDKLRANAERWAREDAEND